MLQRDEDPEIGGQPNELTIVLNDFERLIKRRRNLDS